MHIVILSRILDDASSWLFVDYNVAKDGVVDYNAAGDGVVGNNVAESSVGNSNALGFQPSGDSVSGDGEITEGPTGKLPRS
jgi:hypothetical protein